MGKRDEPRITSRFIYELRRKRVECSFRVTHCFCSIFKPVHDSTLKKNQIVTVFCKLCCPYCLPLPEGPINFLRRIELTGSLLEGYFLRANPPPDFFLRLFRSCALFYRGEFGRNYLKGLERSWRGGRGSNYSLPLLLRCNILFLLYSSFSFFLDVTYLRRSIHQSPQRLDFELCILLCHLH